MRNVFRIFRNDLRSIYKHFFVLLIILSIMVLPALYAWFNIYAFWDPYGSTGNVQVAVVSNDRDYMNSDGEIINMGSELIGELKNEDQIGYVFLDNSDDAINGVYSGDYYAAVVIDPDFTYNMYNFLTTDMFSPTINFYQNEKSNAVAVKIVEASADSIKRSVNEKYIQAIVETLFKKLNSFSSDVEGDNPTEMLRNTLEKINTNLMSYNDTIDHFIDANNSLIDTLNSTNNTLDYSIYLIGNERVNISDQIYYIENIQGDLAKINAEVNNMLTNIEASIDEAIYKLDRLHQGNTDDPEAAQKALEELERQYQELIDYITHSGLTGNDVDDALSALNTLTEKITELRAKLGMTDNTAASTSDSANQTQVLVAHNQDAISALETDFSSVAVPKVYKAVTGYDYEDLTNSENTQQTFESIVSFMMDDTDSRITSIENNLALAESTEDPEVRSEALASAKEDTAVVQQELAALNVAATALGTASGNTDASGKVTAATDSASESTKSASDIYDQIFSSDRDIDLKRDLELIRDALESTRTTLTEVVYPAINSMLDDLQDTLGDMSSLLLELSGVLGKTQPIVNALGDTFGAVNNTLIQVKDLINSYSSRINDFIGVLDGGGDNEALQAVLDFFNIDPETIGSFLASPVETELEAVYPVESYGTAMTPFYTMLAIWVGCIILNAILKIDAPIEMLGARPYQTFFGRYLLFFLLSQIQTLIIALGDILILGVSCVHPGLFILACAITSMTCSMLCYGLTIAFGNVGRALVVIIMIIQIAGSGGSYPIELLPGFFQNVYTFFPFPYAINAMREAIAGLYQNDYLIYLLQLLIFFAAGLFIGLVVRRPLVGLNKYMNDQLDKTEMM